MTHYAAIALTPTSEDWIPGYLETVTGLVRSTAASTSQGLPATNESRAKETTPRSWS